MPELSGLEQAFPTLGYTPGNLGDRPDYDRSLTQTLQVQVIDENILDAESAEVSSSFQDRDLEEVIDESTLLNQDVILALDELPSFKAQGFRVADDSSLQSIALRNWGVQTYSTPLPDADNLFFSPSIQEAWDRIAPFIMPIGPGGAGPVPIRVNSGSGPIGLEDAGAFVDLSQSHTIKWTHSHSDKSCEHPQNLNRLLLGLAANSARLSMVLLKDVETLDKDQNDPANYRFVNRVETCSKATEFGTKQCSGLLEADGRTVWTAYHCFLGGRNGLAGDKLPELSLDEPISCELDSPFRAISILSLLNNDFRVSQFDMVQCKYIERVGSDVVKVHLDRALPVPKPNPLQGIGAWRFPKSGEIQALLTPDRRLYGLGFPRSAILNDLTGGRLFPIRYCTETLAEVLPQFAGGPKPDDLERAIESLTREITDQTMSYEGYACVSTSTYNGTSGGPVFAVDDDGESLVLIGVISAARWIEYAAECIKVDDLGLDHPCGVEPRGQFNTIALLP